jgi:hypothetical protein
MYHYTPFNPYDQYTYYAYTQTTNVPTYTLQHTLLSLSDQQSRINAQREALAAEERKVKKLRAATLRRLRVQRLREAMEEQEIEDIVEQILERHRDGDREISDCVMYFSLYCLYTIIDCLHREILREQREQKIAQGLPADVEIQREIKVKQMLEPNKERPTITSFTSGSYNQLSPGQATSTFNTARHAPQPLPEPIPLDTPVVDELSQTAAPSTSSEVPPQYIPETTLKNKRGSRRDSLRPSSRPSSDIHADTPEITTTASQTLEAFMNLRTKLQYELTKIPLSIRSDVAPNAEERKKLQHHMLKLEEILTDVDAVALPTDSPDDVTRTRKARREIVADIVAAIDGIEKHLQPDTPTETFSAAEISDSDTREESEGEDNALIDQEIQRVIRETLARKKDEEVMVESRRSVTVEDVPDVEY